MAKKRMFSLSVIDSDAFTDMPLSAQALYFHLCMRADDDGFIGNPKKIKGMIGASDDDLKLLIAKRFLLTFEDGVIVIKHWRMHNTLQKDRYTPTNYIDERNQLLIKENKAYSFNEGEPVRSLTDSKCKQSGNKMLPCVETECYQDDSDVESECFQSVSEVETNRYQNGNADIDKDKIKNRLDIGGSYNPINGIIPKEEQSKPSVQTPPPPDTHTRDKPKKAYGKYKHVILSNADLEELRKDFTDEEIQDGITYTDEYVQMKGNKQTDYKLALIKWGIDGGRKERKKQSKSGGSSPPNNRFVPQMKSPTYDNMDEIEQALLAN